MDIDILYKIIEYISIFIALMVVLSIHEFAHAFTAVKCGDDTPKLYNRYTLNPFAHFDLIGLLCFTFLGFGWSKPVPVNPLNFKRYKLGSFLVSIAGVLTNYLLAFLVYPLAILALVYVPDFLYFDDVLSLSLLNIVSLSLVFSIFNFLPFYPLDGFRMIDALNKKHGGFYCFLKNKGPIILYVLFGLGIIARYTGFWYIDILGNFITFVEGIISIPIYSFWGLIL